MRRRRFYFIEPSKVGSQHITLIEGYLQALTKSDAMRQSFDLVFCGSNSTVARFSKETRDKIRHTSIPVMNPKKRRLVLKTFVEFFVVLRYLLTMHRGDIIFISCVLPTTLLMLEAFNALLRRRGVFVSLHGEIEGLFDKSLQHFRSYGFWIRKWIELRRSNSTLALVVIDDFIKRKLLAEYPDKLTDNDVLVVHHPISPFSAANLPIKSVQSVCFIGYRTRFKNFEQFKQLSDLIPHVSFMAIGDGIVEDLRLARTFPISGTDDYLLKISECSIAVFPYNSGYTCSLPASVLDALSTGVYIIASDRPAFTSLQEYLGPEFITIFCSNSESLVFLSDTQWIEQKRSGKARRLEKLLKSKYGPDAVRASFEKIILAQTLP